MPHIISTTALINKMFGINNALEATLQIWIFREALKTNLKFIYKIIYKIFLFKVTFSAASGENDSYNYYCMITQYYAISWHSIVTTPSQNKIETMIISIYNLNKDFI